MKQEQVTTERVNWWGVVGGVMSGLSIGLAIGIGGLVLGMAAASYGLNLVGVLTLGVPALSLWLIWHSTRRRKPSFASGFVVGGCFAVMLLGLCNAVMNGPP